MRLTPNLSKKGYYVVSVGRGSHSYVHRLLAEFFIDDWDEDLQVNHINGVKTDNRLENLEMVTLRQNMQHAFRLGLINNTGSNNGNSKLNEVIVANIKNLLNEGRSNADISRTLNVPPRSISRIKCGEIRRHV